MGSPAWHRSGQPDTIPSSLNPSSFWEFHICCSLKRILLFLFWPHKSPSYFQTVPWRRLCACLPGEELPAIQGRNVDGRGWPGAQARRHRQNWGRPADQDTVGSFRKIKRKKIGDPQKISIRCRFWVVFLVYNSLTCRPQAKTGKLYLLNSTNKEYW